MRSFALPFILIITLGTTASAQDKCKEDLGKQKFGEWLKVTAKKAIDWTQPRFINASQIVPNDFFVPQSEDEVIVGINGDGGFLSNKFASTSVRYLSGYYHEDEKNVFYRRLQSPGQMLQHLLHIYRTHGPINKLLLVGHGGPGSIGIGSLKVGPIWYLINHQQLSNLPSDFFAPNAQVVLVSCNTASGYSVAPQFGIRSLSRIFKKLLQQGGQVYASRTIVSADINDFDDIEARKANWQQNRREANLQQRYPLALQSAAVIIMGIKALQKGLSLITSDWKSLYGEEVVVIDIPPSQASPQ